MSSEVREMNSADALVENTAIDDRLFHGIEWKVFVRGNTCIFFFLCCDFVPQVYQDVLCKNDL